MHLTRISFVISCVGLLVVFCQSSSFAADNCTLLVSVGSGSQQVSLTDQDCDGIPSNPEDCSDCTLPADNCVDIPNGPDQGTCTSGENAGTLCDTDTDCGSNGFCSKDQENSDGDAFGDACDYCQGNGYLDRDEDGICDMEDNCYGVPNPEQIDTDGDGYGDECTNGIPRITRAAAFSGSYDEIGQQIAVMFPDTIIYAWQVFTNVLALYGVSAPDVQDYYDLIEDIIPESIKSHMQGMALGLTEARPLSYETAWDIVLINSLFINALDLFEDDAAANHVMGCTAFAVSSEAGTFLAHNTDNQKGNEHMGSIMYVVPENGDHTYLHMYTPAFSDVALGLNDQGLGVTFNVGNPNTYPSPGLPPLFMLRHVIEKAGSLEEALGYFTDLLDEGHTFGPAGTIFLLVDFKDSSMAKIQVRSEKVKITYGEELKPGVTYIASTNHFDEDFRDDPDYYYESSFLRMERLMELLPAYDTYDLDTCWSILSDHGETEPNNNTISRDGTSTGTTITNIFTADGMYYTSGMPHRYLETFGSPRYVDFNDLSQPASTQVTSFTADSNDRSASLAWESLTEVGNDGFHVYRSNLKNGRYVRINPYLIPGQGTPDSGSSYQYLDETVKNLRIYWYKLAAVDLNGNITLHGPVRAIPNRFFRN